MAANARLMELGNPQVRSRSFALCLTEEDQEISWREGRAGSNITTVRRSDFSGVMARMMRGSLEMEPPPGYSGRLFRRTDGTALGIRVSERNGVTLDLYRVDGTTLEHLGKVHQK